MSQTTNIINKISNILSKSELTRLDTLDILKAIEFYFRTGRPREFKNVEPILVRRYREILAHLTIEEGVSNTDNFFLFSYSLTDDYKKCQVQIYDKICMPYLEWLKNKTVNIDFKPEQNKEKKVLFLTRHAVTAGGYAPGMSTFTFAKAFANQNYQVSIVTIGSFDNEFTSFVNKRKNVELYQISEIGFKAQLTAFLKIVAQCKPSFILTEIEFGIPAFLSISNFELPIIYLAPGYYNLPWFDRIGLTDTLSKEPVGEERNNYFEIPTYVDFELLSPLVDIRDVRSKKQELQIHHTDFVIGNFSRMEKFSDEFLNMLHKILDSDECFKVILAGPNDRDRVTEKLKKFISIGRAFVLGPSDVHQLGHLLNAGLDTFPNHSGFCLNELMAKGIPVVSKWSSAMDSNWEMKIPELVLKSEEEVIETLLKLKNDGDYYNSISRQSSELMKKKEKNSEFISIIEDQLSIIRGR